MSLVTLRCDNQRGLMMDKSPDTARPEELVAEFLDEFRAAGNYRRDCVA